MWRSISGVTFGSRRRDAAFAAGGDAGATGGGDASATTATVATPTTSAARISLRIGRYDRTHVCNPLRYRRRRPADPAIHPRPGRVRAAVAPSRRHGGALARVALRQPALRRGHRPRGG